MSKRFFSKELVDNKIYTDRKWPIPFESVDGDIGVLQTEDEYLIGQCQRLIQSGKGGVSEISEETYDSLKKKIGSRQSGQRWQNQALSGKDLPNPLRNIGIKGVDVSFAAASANKPKDVKVEMAAVSSPTPSLVVPDMQAFKPKRGRTKQASSS